MRRPPSAGASLNRARLRKEAHKRWHYWPLRLLPAIALTMAGTYLFIALFTYSPADPAWSGVLILGEEYANAAGKKGAWVSDILFSFLGDAAYLLGIAAFAFAWQKMASVRALDFWPWAPLGGILLVAGGAAADAPWPRSGLPAGTGGLVGQTLFRGLCALLPPYPAFLIALTLSATGILLILGLRPSSIFEMVGEAAESASSRVFRLVKRFWGYFYPALLRWQGEESLQEDDALQAHSPRLQVMEDEERPEGPLEEPHPLLKTFPELLPDLAAAGQGPAAHGDARQAKEEKLPRAQARDAEESFPEDEGAAHEPLLGMAERGTEEQKKVFHFPQIFSFRYNVQEKKDPVLAPGDAYVPREASHHLFSPLSPSAKEPLFSREEEPKEFPPSLSLLDIALAAPSGVGEEMLLATSRLIEARLAEFSVQVRVTGAVSGPVATRYEVEPALGVKGAQVVALTRDLARALSVSSIRVVESIPGKTVMGLEIPNPKRKIVRLREVLESKELQENRSPLLLALGQDISGMPVAADLGKMPHLLVAGTTGSGKSVAVNAMILSLLLRSTPEEVRLILIDPKMLEFSIYEGVAHLLAPVVTDMKEAAGALAWCVAEMERRYRLMASVRVRNLSAFNDKVKEGFLNAEGEIQETLPSVVVVIDELADLMMMVGKKVEELIARLAQKARAAGIHLILATQRPSVDVITGLIKANVPSRIAFQVSSKVDSRTILDQGGAETLLGQGDMLFLTPGKTEPRRVHGAFVSDEEVMRVVEAWKSICPCRYHPEILAPADDDAAGFLDEGGESDPLYSEAVTLVLKHRRASISFVQRQLGIGYNRAAKLVEKMEQEGIVSPAASNGNREVLANNP